jgi:alpha-glucosidase
LFWKRAIIDLLKCSRYSCRILFIREEGIVFLHKIDTPENFSFGSDRREDVTPGLSHLGEGVFRYEVRSSLWKSNYSQAVLEADVFLRSAPPVLGVGLKEDGGVSVSHGDDPIISTVPGMGFGVSGSRWMMVFDYSPKLRFYGMGEKFNGLEKTGVRTRFWNTDVMADFAPKAVADAEVDPLYVTIPYLLIVRPEGAVGILLDNPFASFMSVAAPEGVTQLPEEATAPRTYIGAPDGRPVLYFITGETPLAVTRKLQRLCGRTPLPPVWALGHHQSRWGYRSAEDLREIGDQFRKHSIPNDGLWLDIDYMDGYRVFTFDRESFKNPSKELKSLAGIGRVCPILDPGVKVDPKYAIYTEAVDQGLLCMNSEGRPYVGFVWPGRTVFPDFSLPKTREWWAAHVKTFADTGVSGVWVDMNDPSTGSADFEDMRFGGGKFPHETYHNQYALGMQMATREGFLQARPNERPFVLSRSGFISTSRYAAIWTGDSVSNYAYLRQIIPVCLNLALSGIPFVGGDVGGFDGDATPQLLTDWYKAVFLFPVFRNHSCKGTRRQEPWAMGAGPRKTIARYVRLRYKMLPYLYSLFVAQENSGDPILRPLFLEFPESGGRDLTRVADQFMVGPAVMQAPFVNEAQEKRTVELPPGSWFDPGTSRWIKGGRRIPVMAGQETTPLYFRDGTIVPMLCGEPKSESSDFSNLEIHLFLSRSGISRAGSAASAPIIADDGISYDYLNGVRSTVELRAWVEQSVLHIDVSRAGIGFRPFDLQFVVYDEFKGVILHQDGERELTLKSAGWDCCGTRIQCRKTGTVIVDR